MRNTAKKCASERPDAVRPLPELSFIVPAYDEERELPATLEALREAAESTGFSWELIVVDNNSSDRTAEVAQKWGARVVFEPINQISRARNSGGRAAQGQVLFFVDADTRISGELVRSALERMEDGRICGGGTIVTFEGKIGWMAGCLLRFWSWVSRRWQLAAGSFVFCSREAYEAVGGFSEAVYAGEEIFFSRAVKRWAAARGQQFVIIEDQAVLTSPRKMSWFSPLAAAWTLFILTVFPLAVRFRCLCGFWYTRPDRS